MRLYNCSSRPAPRLWKCLANQVSMMIDSGDTVCSGLDVLSDSAVSFVSGIGDDLNGDDGDGLLTEPTLVGLDVSGNPTVVDESTERLTPGAWLAIDRGDDLIDDIVERDDHVRLIARAMVHV